MDKVELPLLKGKEREKCIPLAVIVGVAILIFVLSLAFLSLTFEQDYKLHYSETSDLDYKVYLKKNNFYSEKYLEKDQTYIASLIDCINADFNYTFKSDENIGLEYSYYVQASLLINDSNGSKIYESKEDLVTKKKFTELNNNTFNISEKLIIDYTRYNKIAEDFIEEYGITAEPKLVINLFIDLQGKHAEFDKGIFENSVMTLEVPLTNKTLQIALDYDLSNSTDEVLQYSSTAISNPVIFKLSIVLAILDIAAIIAIIILIIKYRDPAVKYEKKLNRILRDYKRYITETIITQRTKDLIKTKSLRIEMVKTFEGLMDIRDNLSKQILYHEERPGEEAIFYIITEGVGYVYILKAKDL